MLSYATQRHYQNKDLASERSKDGQRRQRGTIIDTESRFKGEGTTKGKPTGRRKGIEDRMSICKMRFFHRVVRQWALLVKLRKGRQEKGEKNNGRYSNTTKALMTTQSVEGSMERRRCESVESGRRTPRGYHRLHNLQFGLSTQAGHSANPISEPPWAELRLHTSRDGFEAPTAQNPLARNVFILGMHAK